MGKNGNRYQRRHGTDRSGLNPDGFSKPQNVVIDRGSKSKFIFWLANNPYMLLRHKEIINRVGGTIIGQSGSWEVKGLVICASNFRFPRKREMSVVYIAHGTSNKSIGAVWGKEGKEKYEHYMTSGPKQEWCYKKFGHDISGKRNVRIGNTAADAWISNPGLCVSYGRQVLGLKDDKPILLFAPTFGTETFNRVAIRMKPFTEQYHVVMSLHPREAVNSAAVKEHLSWAKIYSGDIGAILFAADVYVGDMSSTAYDFAITGKPMLLAQPIVENAFYDNARWMLSDHTTVFVPEVDNVSDSLYRAIIQSTVRNRAGRNEVQEVYRKSFHYPLVGNATERAVKWIEDTVAERYEK